MSSESQTIPVTSDLLDYDLQISLDGVFYTLRLRWNRRASAWYLDVCEEDGTPIRMGLKVLVDIQLGVRCRHPKWPPGAFLAIDTGPLPHRDPIEPADLGDRVVLVYYPKDQLPVVF